MVSFLDTRERNIIRCIEEVNRKEDNFAIQNIIPLTTYKKQKTERNLDRKSFKNPRPIKTQPFGTYV